MRHVVAVRVPNQVREHLEEFVEPRRRAEPSLRWTDPSRWHITLAFLPDVAEVDLDDLSERLDTACGRRRPMTAGVRGGGVFGGPFAARVVWAGLHLDEADREELGRLATGVRHAAAAAGTVVEGGEFVPHVTLARSPRPRDLTHLIDVLDLYDGPTWRVEEIELVASHVGGGPSRHEVVGVHTLNDPDRGEGTPWWRSGYKGR